MVTRTVKSTDDLALLKVYLDGRKRPFTVDVTEGRDRSTEQNRLAFKWYIEISDQTGEDREDVRARCKLKARPHPAGSPRELPQDLRPADQPLDYAEKIDLIRDTECRSEKMNVEQMSRYLDIVFVPCQISVVLTIHRIDMPTTRKASSMTRLIRKALGLGSMAPPPSDAACPPGHAGAGPASAQYRKQHKRGSEGSSVNAATR